MDNSPLIAKIRIGKLESGNQNKLSGIDAELILTFGRKELTVADLIEYKSGKRENLALLVRFSEKSSKGKDPKTASGSLSLQLPDYPGAFVFGIPASSQDDFPKAIQYIHLEVSKPFVDGLSFELPEDRLPDLKSMNMALQMLSQLNAMPDAEADRKSIGDKVKGLVGAADAQRKGMEELGESLQSRSKDLEKRFEENEKKLEKLKEEEAKLPKLKDQNSELNKVNRDIGKLQKELKKSAAALAEIELAGASISRLSKKLKFKGIPSEEEVEKELAINKEKIKKANYNRYKQVEEALEEYVGKLKEEIGEIGKKLEASRQALEVKNDQTNKELVADLEKALSEKDAEINTNSASLDSARKKIKEVESSEDGIRKAELDELVQAMIASKEGPSDELRIKRESLTGLDKIRKSLIQALQEGQLKLEAYEFERIMLLHHNKEDARQLKQLEKSAQKMEAEIASWLGLVDQFKSAYKRLFEKDLKEIPRHKVSVHALTEKINHYNKAAYWQRKNGDLGRMASDLSSGPRQLPELHAFAGAVSIALYLISLDAAGGGKEFNKTLALLSLEAEQISAANNFAQLTQTVVLSLKKGPKSEKNPEKELQNLLKKARRAFEKPTAPDFRNPASGLYQTLADQFRLLPEMTQALLQVRLGELKLPGKSGEKLGNLLNANVLHAVLNGSPGQKGAAAKQLLRTAPEKSGEIVAPFLRNLLKSGLENLAREISSRIKSTQKAYPEWAFDVRRIYLGQIKGGRPETIFAFSGADAGKGIRSVNQLLTLHLGEDWSTHLLTRFVWDSLTDRAKNLGKGEISEEVKSAFARHKEASLAEAVRRYVAAGGDVKALGIALPKGKALNANSVKFHEALASRDKKFQKWNLSGSVKDLEELLEATRWAMALGGINYLTVGSRRLFLEHFPDMEKALSRIKLGWEGISNVWGKYLPVEPIDNQAFLLENLIAAQGQLGEDRSSGVENSAVYWERALRSALISSHPIDLAQIKAGKTQTGLELYTISAAIAAEPENANEILGRAYPKSKDQAATFLKNVQIIADKLLGLVVKK